MDYLDEHKKDHDRIIDMLNSTEKVITIEKDVLLLNEKINEFKSDREKSHQTLMWMASAAFAIIMAVAGFGIQANANIQVLQEKVQEQKKEIEKYEKYIHEHE